MFNRFSKTEKIIIWFFIFLSWLLVFPFFFWIGYFIGFGSCKKEIQTELKAESIIDSEDKINENYLEINKL